MLPWISAKVRGGNGESFMGARTAMEHWRRYLQFCTPPHRPIDLVLTLMIHLIDHYAMI